MSENKLERRAPAALANPIRGRFNAAFFRFMDWYIHRKYRELKPRLFAGLTGGDGAEVVEIGAGTGANFRYMKPGTRVIAIEPNVHMHPALERSARRYNIDLEIRGLVGEDLDLADGSARAVICSLVLCSVDDPGRVLSEVRRILAPGGRFICIEHVAAPPRSLVGRIQRWLERPWRWVFEGCHTHRDTAATLEAAGFSDVELERFTWPSAFVPVRPQIAAVCTR